MGFRRKLLVSEEKYAQLVKVAAVRITELGMGPSREILNISEKAFGGSSFTFLGERGPHQDVHNHIGLDIARAVVTRLERKLKVSA